MSNTMTDNDAINLERDQPYFESMLIFYGIGLEYLKFAYDDDKLMLNLLLAAGVPPEEITPFHEGTRYVSARGMEAVLADGLLSREALEKISEALGILPSNPVKTRRGAQKEFNRRLMNLRVTPRASYTERQKSCTLH